MKARVKATGELLEVKFRDTDTEHPYICDMQGENGTLWKESELEFLDDDPDYWTRLEHLYAGMTMQGMISNEYTHKLYLDNKNYPNGLLNDSIAIAHTLVEKLKEKEEK